MHTQIIAHRGASIDAPENTMAAFRLAEQQGADLLEFDVHATADGALVVFHDDTTERWNGQPDPIGQLTLAQLATLDIRGEAVPTLDELLAWIATTELRFNLEIKDRNIEAPVVAALTAHRLTERVIISSFDMQVLAVLRDTAPEIPRGVLQYSKHWPLEARPAPDWPIPTLQELGATAWHPDWQMPLLDQLIPQVRAAGFAVNVWTVDDATVMRRLLTLSADGIITNLPERLGHVSREWHEA